MKFSASALYTFVLLYYGICRACAVEDDLSQEEEARLAGGNDIPVFEPLTGGKESGIPIFTLWFLLMYSV